MRGYALKKGLSLNEHGFHKKIGGKIYADTKTKLAHHGGNAYIGNIDNFGSRSLGRIHCSHHGGCRISGGHK